MDPEQQRSILPLEGDRLQQDAAPLHRPPDRPHLRIPGRTVNMHIASKDKKRMHFMVKLAPNEEKKSSKAIFHNCRAALFEKIFIFASEYRAFDHINYNFNER